MKKIVALIATFVFASAAFALDFAVGVRGNFDMNLGTTFNKDAQKSFEELKKDEEKGVSSPVVPGGGLGIYGHIGFLDLGNLTLGTTLEFGMTFNNGKASKMTEERPGKDGWVKTTRYAHSIDIPFMITLKIPVGEKVRLDFGVGPNISFPFGAGEVSKNSVEGGDESEEKSPVLDYKYNDDGYKVAYDMNIGLVFDADLGFRLGSGYFLIDLRYLLDFTPTTVRRTYFESGSSKTDRIELFYRRCFNIGLGYEFCF